MASDKYDWRHWRESDQGVGAQSPSTRNRSQSRCGIDRRVHDAPESAAALRPAVWCEDGLPRLSGAARLPRH